MHTIANEFEMSVIYSITRRQLIEDGVLVQISGPGYEGDDWLPRMVAEAGIRFPLAMTAEVFGACVSPLDDSETLASCQDIKGRLWDVLWMFAQAARRASGDELLFSVYVVPNVPNTAAGKRRTPRPKRITLKAVIGGDDDGSPCITIMYPHQD